MVLWNLERRRNPDKSKDAGTHQRDKHREQGMSDAPECAHQNVHDTAECIDGANPLKPYDSVLNDGGVIGIDGKQGLPEKYSGISQKESGQDDIDFPTDENPLDSSILSGSIILAGKGHGRLVK